MRYPHTFSGREASQNKFELESLIALLVEKKVKRYLEIGAREGDTFHEIMLSLPLPEFGLAVDYPGGLWGKHTTSKKLELAINDLKSKGLNCSCLLGDSKDMFIVREAERYCWDAIFIDGDHTLDGVTADWKNYGDLAPIIIFHDIVGQDQKEKVHGNLVEVPKLWAVLKEEFKHIEFIDEGSQMGIGVIFR